MQNRSQYWSQHIAAAKLEGLSMAAYAKKHGLGESTLYRWQQKLSSANSKTGHPLPNAESPSAAAPVPVPGKFIALRVANNGCAYAVKPNADMMTKTAPVDACTLQLPGGIDLQMQTLPEPAWLMALSRCATGAH